MVAMVIIVCVGTQSMLEAWSAYHEPPALWCNLQCCHMRMMIGNNSSLVLHSASWRQLGDRIAIPCNPAIVSSDPHWAARVWCGRPWVELSPPPIQTPRPRRFSDLLRPPSQNWGLPFVLRCIQVGALSKVSDVRLSDEIEISREF